MKKKSLIIAIVIVAVVIGVIGSSYSLWILTKEQTNLNKLATSCLSVTLTEDSDAITLNNSIPMYDADGMKLTPYTFTITNTCDLFISYQVSLNMLPTTTLNSKYVAAVLDRNEVKTLDQYEVLDTLSGYQESRLLDKGSLSQDDSVTYNLRVWMDESVGPSDIDAMDKVFQAKIALTVQPSTYSPVEQGFNTLADAMLVNEYQSMSVVDAKAKIASKQAPDFTKTAPIIDWQEVHANTTSSPSATMIDPNNNNSASEITDANSKIRIGKGYTFNSETAQYTITDLAYYDPTEITDYTDTDYYWCSSGVSFSSSDTANGYANTSCTTMYKLLGVSSTSATTTGPSGTKFNMIKYTFTAYAYTQGELESDKSDRGLYVAQDDDGDTYYYRGSVNNNYVKFAGAYWRIIRLNGDGTVRLLYAGTTPTAAGSELSINKSTSAFNSSRDNPAYVGYMRGSTLGVDYATNFSNEVDSTIKTKLDTWYATNIAGKDIESYVADSVFCNDREVYTGDGVSTTVNTYYKPYQRYYNDKNPTYSCSQANDKFTVSTEKGNGALTYPIGLITVDELMYAGMTTGYLNRMSYVYSNQHYWTMSPSAFNGFNLDSSEFILYLGGFAGTGGVTSGLGVRAVINLKSDAPITGGIGTANNPFVVS